jgi:hypothetical protein
VSPAFVAAMQNVLDLYAEAYDPDYPVVGFHERQLIAETPTPLPAHLTDRSAMTTSTSATAPATSSPPSSR